MTDPLRVTDIDPALPYLLAWMAENPAARGMGSEAVAGYLAGWRARGAVEADERVRVLAFPEREVPT